MKKLPQRYPMKNIENKCKYWDTDKQCSLKGQLLLDFYHDQQFETQTHILQRQQNSPIYFLIITVKPAFYLLKVWFLYQKIYQLLLINTHTIHTHMHMCTHTHAHAHTHTHMHTHVRPCRHFCFPILCKLCFTPRTFFSSPMHILGFKTKVMTPLQHVVFSKPHYVRMSLMCSI